MNRFHQSDLMQNKLCKLLMGLSAVLALLTVSACEFPFIHGQNQSDYQAQSRVQSRAQQEDSSEIFVESLDRWMVFFWQKGPFPSPMQSSVYEILFLDSQRRLAPLPESLRIEVFAWMPDMGHGSADDGYVEDMGDGRYVGHEMRFNMPGFWHIHILIYQKIADQEALDEILLPVYL